ncbi:MAG: bacteriocin immunity protein [bacterium]
MIKFFLFFACNHTAEKDLLFYPEDKDNQKPQQVVV